MDGPTEWVSSLVIVEKADGRLRVCLNPSDLNKVVKREHHPMPTAVTVMSEMWEAKYCSNQSLMHQTVSGILKLTRKVQSSLRLTLYLAVIDSNVYHLAYFVQAKFSKRR